MAKQQQLPLYCFCSIDPKIGFFVSRLEDYLDNNKNLFFPHQHDFYQVVFFTGGSGNFSIDFEKFPVGNIYFMVPGQVHTWNFNRDVKGFIIHFSASFVESFVRIDQYLDQFSFLSGYVKDQVITMNIPGDISMQMSDIIAEKDTGDLRKVLLLRLLLSVDKQVARPASKIREKHSLVMKRFKSLVSQTVQQHKLPGEYANDLSVSLDYLNNVCRKEARATAGKIIRDRVIVEAKRLMINNKITMTEISNRLAFPGNSYFTKFFRKYTGTTPDKFRSNINQVFDQ